MQTQPLQKPARFSLPSLTVTNGNRSWKRDPEPGANLPAGPFSRNSKELEPLLNSRCLILTPAPGFDGDVGSVRKGS